MTALATSAYLDRLLRTESDARIDRLVIDGFRLVRQLDAAGTPDSWLRRSLHSLQHHRTYVRDARQYLASFERGERDGTYGPAAVSSRIAGLRKGAADSERRIGELVDECESLMAAHEKESAE